MNKNIIAIISHERSGSTWLSSIFSNTKNINLSGLLDPNIDSTTIDYLLDQHNIEIDTTKDKNDILKKIIDFSLKNNKNIIIKIMKYHQYNDTNNIIINQILNNSLIIKLYRKNILNAFISREKSISCSCWTEIQNKNKQINKQDIKILWDKQKYIDFYNYKTKEILWMKQILNHNTILEYENINNIDNKILFNYLKNSIGHLMDIGNYKDNYIYNTNIIKESSISLPISENFTNKDIFIKDFLVDIPIYIKYNEPNNNNSISQL